VILPVLETEMRTDAITRLEKYICPLFLRTPPSNRLHALKSDRQGQHAISINDQWRICFRFEAGDAFDVEITYYH